MYELNHTAQVVPTVESQSPEDIKGHRVVLDRLPEDGGAGLDHFGA